MKIIIDNTEVVCSNDFTIKEDILNTPSVILNNVYPKSWEDDKDYVSRYYYPEDYSQCCIYEDDEEINLIFCGVVKNSGQISLNPRMPHYATLQILDYKTFLSEGETLDFVIANKTILEAIDMVINTIEPYGFSLGNVDILGGNDIIGAYSTKDKTAYDVFNYIADITQSRWTTRTYGEGYVYVDFYDPTLMPQGTRLRYQPNWFKSHNIIDMSFNYGTWDYRNKQVMTSSEVIGDTLQTQSITYDGYSNEILLYLPIGKIDSILIDGVEKTFSTNDEKNLGITADFYYKPGNSFLEKNTTIYVGADILINYYPIVEGRQIVNNTSEISRVASATGVKGVIARYENRNDATTSGELQKIGQSYIKYKGVPEIKLTVKTTDNIWNIGERVPTLNMPITELATTYMVKKKEINYVVSTGIIFYKFELVSSFNSESSINYFDNQRAKANGNLGKGESISRNIDIEDSANIIFYDTEAEAINIISNNTLEGNLEMILGE